MLVIILVFIISGSLVDESYSQTSPIIKNSGLPEGERPMKFDDVGKFGIDSDGNLYWDGKRVQILNEISLKEREFRWAVLGILATCVIAFTSLIDCIFKYIDRKKT